MMIAVMMADISRTIAIATRSAVSCREKIKVLNENLLELQEMAQDALEDAVIMGADEEQVRQTLRQLVESLANPYQRQDGE